MTVCKKCGHKNPAGDEFCANCGAFLEYYGEKVPEEKPAAVVGAATAPAPPPKGIVERVKEAVVGEQPPRPAPTPEAPPPPPSPPVGEGRGGGTQTTPTAPAPPPPETTPLPKPEQPVSVRPDEVAPPRPTTPRPTTAERPRPQPGELICGECGWGNDPARKFCRHCGNSLHDAVRVRIPWYRRLLPRRRPLAAGERPAGLRRRLDTEHHGGFAIRMFKAVRNLVIVVLIALAALYAAVPPVRDAVNARVQPVVTDLRKQIIPHDAPVHAVGASATGELPGHGASLAVDSFANTYWAADVSGGKQPVLTVLFDRPVDLYDYLFLSGAPDNFQAQGRPRDLHIAFSDGRTWDLTLKDQPDKQQYSFTAKKVDRIEIQIRSVYPSATGSGVAIRDIEFFTRT